MKRSTDKSSEHVRCKLGGFPWLDKRARLRRWFAKWLTGYWEHLYSDSLQQLHTKAEWDAYRKMDEAVKCLALGLTRLPTAEQLAAVDAEARKVGFKTTREQVEDHLRYFLERFGQQREHAPAFKASPWCAHFAMEEQNLKDAGKDLPYKHYPHDPDARMALETVISEFGSPEIWRGVSPEMSQRLALHYALLELENAIGTFPPESPLLHAFRKLEPRLKDFGAMLQSDIEEHAAEPAAILPPIRVRRSQRCLYFAIRRLCKRKDGPPKLAALIGGILKNWPTVPAGMPFELSEHFTAEKRRMLIRKHLGLIAGRTSKEARALWHVLNAMIFRDELKNSLLHLAHKARGQAEERRKGWKHLQKALRAVFQHIGRELSNAEQFRNFERAHFHLMRNVARKERMRLLPELGNDPDKSVRDLKNSERMFLFNPDNKTPFGPDADGRNSFSRGYGRAMKSVRKELGQE